MGQHILYQKSHLIHGVSNVRKQCCPIDKLLIISLTAVPNQSGRAWGKSRKNSVARCLMQVPEFSDPVYVIAVVYLFLPESRDLPAASFSRQDFSDLDNLTFSL